MPFISPPDALRFIMNTGWNSTTFTSLVILNKNNKSYDVCLTKKTPLSPEKKPIFCRLMLFSFVVVRKVKRKSKTNSKLPIIDFR